jgi:hypothetical protein
MAVLGLLGLAVAYVCIGFLVYKTWQTIQNWPRWLQVVIWLVDLPYLLPMVAVGLAIVRALVTGVPGAPFAARMGMVLSENGSGFGSVLAGMCLGYSVWKGWFFYVFFESEAAGGELSPPRWPRPPYQAGRKARGPRRFREPAPWTAGPYSH